MKAMTRRQADANFPVLRLYYVQAVRSLVDYSAPVLVIRTILGAFKWCSACVRARPNRCRSLPGYTPPPPWESPVTVFTTTLLPAFKASCTFQEMRQQALMSIHEDAAPESFVYNTDGSVDPENGRSGAAFVTGGLKWAWRTSGHCPTLQTELVAILHAL